MFSKRHAVKEYGTSLVLRNGLTTRTARQTAQFYIRNTRRSRPVWTAAGMCWPTASLRNGAMRPVAVSTYMT